MLMPVEEYEKSKAKQSIERKIQGKAIFFWEELPSREMKVRYVKGYSGEIV